jgi:protein O-mannosyl-transferase
MKQPRKSNILKTKNVEEKPIRINPGNGKRDFPGLWGYFIIIVFCFVCYGNTLTLKYALDDMMVITGNQFTKEGFDGIKDILTTDLFAGYFGKDQNMVAGGRYRPLSLLTFAVEYQIFGENPMISHLVNLLLFICTALILYSLLRKLLLFKEDLTGKSKWFFSIPFITTILFIAHPIHTEVIANIKGRDEILSFLGSLLSLSFTLTYIKKKNPVYLVYSGISFFLGLTSKESTITFLAVIPLALYYFTNSSWRKVLTSMAPLLLASVLFLVIRQVVIGHPQNQLANDLMNNPFVEMTTGQKYATIFYTLGLYLKLLFIPTPLTFDYYPYHIPIVAWSELKAIIPLIIYLSLGVFSLWALRKKSLVSFGILYYMITLSIVSNLVFPIGAFMNERFIYASSLGFCLILGWMIAGKLPKVIPSASTARTITIGLLTVILTLYAIKTISRNSDWYDSYSLFTTDVNVSKNSAKGNALAGEYLLIKASHTKEKQEQDRLYRESIKYQQKAIKIYPKQIIALFNLAAVYHMYNQDYDTVLAVYKTILKYLPDNQKVYDFFNYMMSKYPDVDHKIKLYEELYTVNPARADVNFNLGAFYLLDKGDAKKALPYLEQAAKLNATDFNTQNCLGIAYGSVGKWNEAEVALENALKIKPDDPLVLKNLVSVNKNLGNPVKAGKYLELFNSTQKK